jgi:hypothetical protein
VLVEQAGHIVLVRGSARFRVGHAAASAQPVRVRVSAGVIEVLGTEFRVWQAERRGWVRLLSGRIRLVLDNGHRVQLLPGERFEWGPPAVPDAPEPSGPQTAAAVNERPEAVSRAELATDPSVSADSGVRGRSPTTSVESPKRDRGVAEVVALRSQGRYAQALALVDELGSAPLDPRSREVLRYERGSLLERLGRHSDACRHWKLHAARFSRGRYAAAVQRTLEERCHGEAGTDTQQGTSGSPAGE